MTPEIEKEYRDTRYFDDVNIWQMRDDLLAEIDRLRAENEKLSGNLLKFGGPGSGQIWGLANCFCCDGLDNDYYFIGHRTVCKTCFDSSLEPIIKERDQLQAENANLKLSQKIDGIALASLNEKLSIAMEARFNQVYDENQELFKEIEKIKLKWQSEIDELSEETIEVHLKLAIAREALKKYAHIRLPSPNGFISYAQEALEKLGDGE
jgi:hypothetical protein